MIKLKSNVHEHILTYNLQRASVRSQYSIEIVFISLTLIVENVRDITILSRGELIYTLVKNCTILPETNICNKKIENSQLFYVNYIAIIQIKLKYFMTFCINNNIQYHSL